MKYKVKGLVFVGFAAAILSANAMAADNTVTSRSFTEATYHKKANANYQVSKSDGTWQALGTTLDTSEQGYNPDNAVTAGTIVQELADLSEAITTQAVQGDWNETDPEDPSYIKNKPTQLSQFTDDIDAENILNGVKVNGAALTPDTNKDVNVTVAPGIAAGTIAVNNTDVAVTNVEVTTHKLEQGGATGSVITSTATDTQYPSALAVYNAIHASEDATTYHADGTTITLDTDSNTFSATAGAIASDNTGLVNGGQVYTGLAAKVDIAQGASSANKTLVTDASGNVTVSAIETAVIPAIDPLVCNATHPCVLTNDTTDGHLVWVPIAQPQP